MVGVGTPKILSPTGGLTTADPYDAARADAQQRLTRLLAELPVDAQRRLKDISALDGRRADAVAAFSSEAAQHFSDGSVHLPARLSFDWAPAAVPAPASAGGAEAPAPPASGPTGLVLVVKGAVRPALRVTLRDEEGSATAHAGLTGDPLGESVTWLPDRADPRAGEAVGARPRVVEVKAGDGAGVLVVSPADRDLIGAAAGRRAWRVVVIAGSGAGRK